MGKIAISLEKPESLISVSPSKYDIILSSTKSYVLSGCLGGIGRSKFALLAPAYVPSPDSWS